MHTTHTFRLVEHLPVRQIVLRSARVHNTKLVRERALPSSHSLARTQRRTFTSHDSSRP